MPPFLFSTVGLFVAGGYFAYKMVYPAALNFLIGYSAQFTPMITINEYTNLFMTIVLGLGVVFEMPILVFFLALFGHCESGLDVAQSALLDSGDLHHRSDHHADHRYHEYVHLCRSHGRLYLASIGVAWLVHPKQRKKRELNSK